MPLTAEVARQPKRVALHEVPARSSRSGAPLFALLFLFLLAVYCVTSGGHTSSNDDEEMYYFVQGIVERGSPAIPTAEGQALFAPSGPDGKFYPDLSHGVLTPVLSVPLYLVGLGVSKLFDPRYHDFLTRAAVTGTTAAATAAAVVALALIAAELGLSPRASTGIGLVYGLTTIAWPYSKYFWGEPLATAALEVAALFALRTARLGSWRWSVLAGAALLAAGSARPAMLAALPAFGVFAVVAGLEKGAGWSEGLFRCARLLGGLLAAPVVAGIALVLADRLRGTTSTLDPVTYLSGTVGGLRSMIAAGTLRPGLQGLLFSPGKSVFLYSPPLIAALVAAPDFIRWRPKAAVLIALVAASQFFVSASVPFWAGESAWGPRYLVPAVPFMLLPLCVWLRPGMRLADWQRWLVGATAGVGLAVQLAAVLVNYDTYIYVTGGPEGPGAQARWYQPSASPLLAAPEELAQRIASHGQQLEPGEFALTSGFQAEDNPGVGLPRWSTGDAVLQFEPRHPGPMAVDLQVMQPDHGQPRMAPELSIQLDGKDVPLPNSIGHPKPDEYDLTVALGEVAGGTHELRLVSSDFVPADTDGGTDTRQLGIELGAATFHDGSGALTLVDLPNVSALPVTDQHQWNRAAFGWFYAPQFPHLVDLWPWYLATSGLPPVLAGLWLVPLAGAGWYGWRISTAMRTARATSWRALMPPVAGVTTAAVVAGGVLGIAAYQSAAAARPAFPSDPQVAIASVEPDGAGAIGAAGAALDRNAAGLGGVRLFVGQLGTTTAVGPPNLTGPALPASGAPVGWSAVVDPSQFAPGDYQLTALGTEAVTGRPKTVSAEMDMPRTPQPNEHGIGSGWYPTEGGDQPLPRWSRGEGELDFFPEGTGQLRIDLTLAQPSFTFDQPTPEATYTIDGQPAADALAIQQASPGLYDVHLFVNVPRQLGQPLRLLITSPTFVPKDHEAGSTDARALGVQVQAVAASMNGRELAFGDLGAPPSSSSEAVVQGLLP